MRNKLRERCRVSESPYIIRFLPSAAHRAVSIGVYREKNRLQRGLSPIAKKCRNSAHYWDIDQINYRNIAILSRSLLNHRLIYIPVSTLFFVSHFIYKKESLFTRFITSWATFNAVCVPRLSSYLFKKKDPLLVYITHHIRQVFPK